jgi:hypothetical protein
MLRIVLAIIILLLFISCIYADGLPSEEAERQAKEHQLEQVAVSFKSETGFRGEINYDTNRMCLGFFEGKFADIRITANADTTSFRAVFEQILDKVLPYTFAKREQLSKRRITNNLGIIQTDYIQQINGYRVEGLGSLIISYEIGRNSFSIGNATVELPDEPLGEIITEAEAYQIAFNLYKQTASYDDKYLVTSKKVIAYKSREVDGISQPYRLYWRISFPKISYFIDAITKDTFSEKHIVVN